MAIRQKWPAKRTVAGFLLRDTEVKLNSRQKLTNPPRSLPHRERCKIVFRHQTALKLGVEEGPSSTYNPITNWFRCMFQGILSFKGDAVPVQLNG